MSYGLHTLADLYGGSGGSGGLSGDGGGGGGSVQLSARGKITVADTGLIAARGGDTDGNQDGGEDRVGGAGSGGGVLLAAATIELQGTTNITVAGGSLLNRGSNKYPGAGGGGRVAFYTGGLTWQDYSSGPDYTNHPPQVVIEGGDSVIDAERGTFYAGEEPEWTKRAGTVILAR
jgi:hypothetical protein